MRHLGIHIGCLILLFSSKNLSSLGRCLSALPIVSWNREKARVVLEGEEMLVKSRATNLEPEPLRIQGRRDEQVSTTMIVGRTENQG